VYFVGYAGHYGLFLILILGGDAVRQYSRTRAKFAFLNSSKTVVRLPRLPPGSRPQF